ncbi:MAG: Short-chain dehydrogenase/reductase [Aeromicrobium sp.]|nr:Short-chain dehydrogenase/reductase [Aeromicrobium sp.]
MSWTQSNIPNLTGRTAVVTGANGGLGLESAEALAGAGAHVVMAVRNQAKAKDAVERILAAHPKASLELVPLDLGDLGSTAAAAKQILANHQKIDLLINNAGVMAMPERTTADGFEMQLGVDHLGHFAFTAHLLPAIVRADGARVVTVTSIARFQGKPLDPDNPHMKGNYGAWRSYGQAKLANYYFGLGLQKKFVEAGVSAQSLLAHPGLSHTDLQSTTAAEGGAGWLGATSETLAARTGMPPHKGVRPQLRAATDPKAKGGHMYGPRFASNGAAVNRPILRRIGFDKRIQELWDVSERETGVTLDVAATRATLSQ